MVSSKEYAALVRWIMPRQKSGFLSAFGTAFQIFKVLVEEVIEIGGSDDDLRSLQTDKVKRCKVAEAIVGNRSAKKLAELREGEYRVRVNRGPYPAMTTLEGQFSKEGVSQLYNGSYEWKKHSSRLGMNDVTSDEVVMVAKEFSEEDVHEMSGLESKNIIAWGLKKGLVAADDKETYAFGINPETAELQCEFWLVGLGSFAMSDDDQRVAVLFSDSAVRCLHVGWFDRGWHRSRRFLFVRK